ncbi:MAG: SH3 domain-containing protein [Leptolyngbya sp. SIO1D8]|nr:SH3 domain-containing protein [Leptolyngbya sp. SIO1D8]
MRSHRILWGCSALLLVSILASCRQSQSLPNTSLISSPNHGLTAQKSSPPRTWPGVSQSSKSSSATDPEPDLANADSEPDQEADSSVDHAGDDIQKIATITAQMPEAQVNVRSLPSQAGDPLGYGLVGDNVTLDRSETDADGHIWYHVTFHDTSLVGWVRHDFLEIQPSPAEAIAAATSPEDDMLKASLDEKCGGPEAVIAYFMTQNYLLYLCRYRGQLLYLSQEKGSSQVIVSESVQEVGGGYIIVNGNYEYRLDSSAFIVVRPDADVKDSEILREPVIHSERY